MKQYNTKELAEMLGLNRNVVRRKIIAGEIKGKKDKRGRWYVKHTDLPKTVRTKTNSTKKEAKLDQQSETEVSDLYQQTSSLQYLSNSIAMSLVLRVNKAGLGFIDLNCSPLPWLSRNALIKSELESAMKRGIAQCKNYGKNPDSLKQTLEYEIADVLEKYEIGVYPELSITIEEYTNNVLKFKKKPDWLTIVSYQQKVFENSNNIKYGDVSIKTPLKGIHFSIDERKRSDSVYVSTRKDILIDKVDLIIAQKSIASQKVGRIFKSNQKTHLDLPIIPIKHYKEIERSGEVEILLTFSGGKILRSKNKCSVPSLSEKVVSMYLDMGSAYVKAFRIDWKTEADKDIVSICNELKSFTRSSERAKVTVLGPSETNNFVKELQLPKYNKKNLVLKGNDAYARWFISCVSSLSSNCLSRGKALFSVHISMPRINNINPKEVTKIVRKEVTPFLLDNIYLVPEHEALRERYGKVLFDLYSKAKSRKSEIENIKQKNRETRASKNSKESKYRGKKRKYESRGWFAKIFYSNPKEPDYSGYRTLQVPNLDEWRQEMLEINADPELQDVIIVDAGGYSLDVYARINNKEYGDSFRAGGMDITRMLQKHLSDSFGRTVSLGEAEGHKCDSCNHPIDPQVDTTQRMLELWTKQIYENSLEVPFDWIKDASARATMGIPIIVTGGAFHNPYLQELTGQLLLDRGIQIKPMSSPYIVQLIEDNKIKLSNILSRFVMITHGFQADRFLLNSFDICGGMIENHVNMQGRSS